tara:strand:+ start:296 stop:547 length:252 start_codon:yes stop_codon:yes gene_type:complete
VTEGWDVGAIIKIPHSMIEKEELGCIVKIIQGTQPHEDDTMWVPTMVSVLVSDGVVHYTLDYLKQQAIIVKQHGKADCAHETS